MLRDILPLDEHVRLADRIGLGVQFLPEHGQPRLWVVLGQIFVGHREHAARARRRVIDGAHHAGLCQHVVILDEQQVDHQPDDFTRREMFSRRLVRDFRELADQFLEDEPHLAVADLVGMQIELRELFGDQIQQPGLASRSICA